MGTPAAARRAEQPEGGRWRLRWGDLGRALLALAGGTCGVLLASWLLPGFAVANTWQAVVVALLLLVAGLVLRPFLVWAAVLTGWVGAVLLGFFGQALLLWLALAAALGEEAGFFTTLVASWIIAAVSTLVAWVATAGTDDAVTSQLLGRAHRSPQRVPDPEIPGIVFIQADGVPFPVLDWGVRAGTLPTLTRWVRGGSHKMVEWRPALPATTPASQLGILHGTIDGVPAFRWVDRELGRTLVANQPGDAAVIERKHSNGRGLLADDGVSVSNLFTGDAPTALATMSAVGRSQETRQTREMISTFLARPNGWARSLSRSISEIARERFQSSQARRRDVRPRVHRGWSFTLERAAINGVLRDLNTTLVGEAMLQGKRSIYVDFVDYDTVAHHVGLMQPEALSALEGIDAVLGHLERLSAVTPRPYHLVVLSDHGQSQGEIFEDRYGEGLAELVARLSDARVHSAYDNAEGTGALTSMVGGAGDPETVMGRAMSRASARLAEHAETLASGTSARPAAEEHAFEVFGSGNLGLIYVAGAGQRLRLDELVDRFPALVPGLAAHPGIGFVVVDTAEHGPVVLGAEGEHHLREGVVTGIDPLRGFGPEAPEFVLRAASMPEAPDIYVNSLVDDFGEVAAFEGLVGCHGGLGGWQDRAMLVWPAELPPPPEMITGADALHRVLVGWLEHLGHRRDL